LKRLTPFRYINFYCYHVSGDGCIAEIYSPPEYTYVTDDVEEKYFESILIEEMLTLKYRCVIYVQRISKPTTHLSEDTRYHDFLLLVNKHSPIALQLREPFTFLGF